MNTRYQTYAQAHTRKEGYYAGFLFLIWPFLAAISAVWNFRKPWAKNIFWAFCAFYGMSFAIGAESQGSDIVRYVAGYQALHGAQMGVGEVITYFLQSGEIDILRLLISYVLSRFTDSQAALTLVYGAIFGYFLSRNLWFILERLEGKVAPIVILLILCFFLVNPIWKINGFRMWTAVHVFLFGLLPWLLNGEKKWLWVSVMSILVHFSFVVPVGVLIGYVFLGNRLNIFFGFYLFTFFIAELDIAVFNDLMQSYAPEILQERTASYRSETNIVSRPMEENKNNWYIRWQGAALSWPIMGFIITLFWTGRDFFKENTGWASLFSFTLLFYGVANILSSLPSGGRFMVIGQLCALALIILYVQNRPHEKAISRLALFASPGLLLYVIVEIRVALLSMSATTVLGNPVLAMFLSGEQLSLNDVLKMLI
jgi:hypothetical protein